VTDRWLFENTALPPLCFNEKSANKHVTFSSIAYIIIERMVGRVHTGTDPTVYMAKKKMKKKNDQEVIAKCDNPIDELHTGTDPTV
jgi:hypothetical protein